PALAQTGARADQRAVCRCELVPASSGRAQDNLCQRDAAGACRESLAADAGDVVTPGGDSVLLELLETRALRVGERILAMATRGGCFLGASLSCADLLVFLYSRWLRFPAPNDPDRDVLLLSKGHDVPALYATLAELGHLDPMRLEQHLRVSDS